MGDPLGDADDLRPGCLGRVGRLGGHRATSWPVRGCAAGAVGAAVSAAGACGARVRSTALAIRQAKAASWSAPHGRHSGAVPRRGRSRQRSARRWSREWRGRRLQGVAVLERSLEDARAERVADDQGEDCGEPGAAVDDELCGDVAAGEEQACREAEGGAAGRPTPRQGECGGACGGAADPEQDRRPVGRMVGLVGVDEREGERRRPPIASEHGDLLVAGEPRRVAAGGGECEDGDAGRADGLDERDGCEPQRRDVDEPADRLRREAGRPSAGRRAGARRSGAAGGARSRGMAAAASCSREYAQLTAIAEMSASVRPSDSCITTLLRELPSGRWCARG